MARGKVTLTAEPGKFSKPHFPHPATRLWAGDKRVHLQMREICCDCSLVHDVEYVIVETKRKRNGDVVVERVAPKRFALQFRVRRNERSTAARRRK